MSESGERSTSPRRRPRKLESRSSRSSRSNRPGVHERDAPESPTTRAVKTFDRRDSELPLLPIDEHSYLNDSAPGDMQRSDGLGLSSLSSEDEPSLDERDMRRHLMDVESSFLPDPAHASGQDDRGGGADDTYLELADPGTAAKSRSTRDHHRSPEPDQDTDDYVRFGDDDDESLPSPAQAASRRANGRNASGSSRAATPRSPDPPSSRGTAIRSSPSSHTTDTAAPDVDDSLSSAGSHSMPTRRPAFLTDRQASHRSSLSSATVTSDLSGSDTTVGADYALQTGGARPGSSSLGGSARAPNFFDRLPSFGSVASYASQGNDTFPTLSKINGALMNKRRDIGIGGAADNDPVTPRQSTSRHDAPTDTALAARVESIHVPETVARDFRAMNSLASLDKRPASSDGPSVTFAEGGRPRRTLTLKEQNAKIDKLAKENFDLKLKIHFLDQALRSHSDEGVQELVDKNVQCQTDLANERKDAQALRRKMRELERKVKEQDDAIAELQQAKSAGRSDDARTDDDDDDPTLQAEMHEEILYLRQQLDHSENQVTTLREEMLTEKFEKRRMAEQMRSLAGSRGQDSSGVRETMEMWQDLLNAETGRREQAEEDLRKLREELTALRIERASPAANRVAGGRRLGRASKLGGHVDGLADDESEYANGVDGSDSNATLVEQLRHENGELRRDLGAQTSMLTSRNRERERLQQEIEDLKLLQRKSDGARSVAGESIFERSISRAHQRASSRASDLTAALTEAERDDWERKEGQLRDQNAELRLKHQDLERAHSTHLQYIAALEGDFQEMEGELNEAGEDLKALSAERDEALHSAEELQQEYERLEQEAVAEIERLEKEREALHAQRKKTHAKLEQTTDSYRGLQSELRDITQSVMSLEDEKQANVRTIEALEQQMAEAEEEMSKWEDKCKEIDEKNRKLEITQESLHSEITFLREEQEGDKIKIGELEDALNAARQTIADELDKVREMEEAMAEERQQRDVLENRSKEEVQKVLDDLNNENARTKDEVRRLRRGLSAKEVEAGSWKTKLEELETAFRGALGDATGSKQSMLGEVERLQRDLEHTTNALDRAKMEHADRDRLLRHRDGLLESTSLESRRLSDLLDKERAARKHDLDQFERSSRGQATNVRTMAQMESRNLELETAFSQDKRKMAALEQQMRDQLAERNALLLALWNRLSTLCGADWAQQHALVNGEVPSADVIARSLPGFNRIIITAVKTIEGVIGNFKLRMRSVEKELWRDYQTLEHNLDMRIRRMDNVERAVIEAQSRMAEEAAQQQRDQQQQQSSSRPQTSRTTSSRSIKGSEEIGKLKSEVKLLKAELKFHRQHPSAMAQQMLHQHTQQHPELARRQSSGPGGLKPPSPARQIVAQLLRHHSSSAVEQVRPVSEEGGGGGGPGGAMPGPRLQGIVLPTPPAQPTEQRWVHRLKELERRLKAEREARLLDRRGARQRLEEGRLQNEELKMMLEREKMRRESGVGTEEGEGEGEDEGEGEYETGDGDGYFRERLHEVVSEDERDDGRDD